MKLYRWGSTPHGTFGSLHMEKGWSCFTIEKPWINNKPFMSCVPAGKYELKETKYNRGGYDAIALMDVPDRSNILFHVGNTAADVSGCIAIGSSLSMVANRWAVANSKPTFAEFMRQSEPETEIEIVWDAPEED